MKMKKKQLDKKGFEQIKLFLSTGATMKKVAEILNRSYVMVNRVKNTTDFAEWEAKKKEYAKEVYARTHREQPEKFLFKDNDIHQVSNVYVKAELAKIQEALGNLIALIPAK